MNPRYIVGAQSSATGTVIDNDGGDTFEFSSAAFAGFVPDYIGTDFSNKEGEFRHDMSYRTERSTDRPGKRCHPLHGNRADKSYGHAEQYGLL